MSHEIPHEILPDGRTKLSVPNAITLENDNFVFNGLTLADPMNILRKMGCELSDTVDAHSKSIKLTLPQGWGIMKRSDIILHDADNRHRVYLNPGSQFMGLIGSLPATILYTRFTLGFYGDPPSLLKLDDRSTNQSNAFILPQEHHFKDQQWHPYLERFAETCDALCHEIIPLLHLNDPLALWDDETDLYDRASEVIETMFREKCGVSLRSSEASKRRKLLLNTAKSGLRQPPMP